jgi:mannose-1-phosphate guanylyltransferase
MQNSNNYAVIMAGGVGSRFWPYSRKKFPKQFHDVLGMGKSLLQQTVERFRNICPNENIFIVANREYKQLILEQLPQIKEDHILLESIGRNTAPCIAYAAYKIHSKNKNANVVVAPSDHIIMKEVEFEKRINLALETSSKKDALVTLGIKPHRPDTGYGYIRFENQESEAHRVLNFTEKPKLEIANAFVSSGEYVWNAGIFIFQTRIIIEKFNRFEPDIANAFLSINDFFYSEKEQEKVDEVYLNCKDISIDYAIMERSANVYVVLSDIGWSDLGTWKSLYDLREKDEENNVLDGNIRTYDTTNSIIKTPDNKLVVAQGLDNYIVAEYDNVLMICQKDKEQKVKEFVSDLKSQNQNDFV